MLALKQLTIFVSLILKTKHKVTQNEDVQCAVVLISCVLFLFVCTARPCVTSKVVEIFVCFVFFNSLFV